MIDIHAHILPGDDGPEQLDDALEMARQAVAGGTTVLFATPHVTDRQDLARVGEIAGRVAALQAEVDRHGIALRIATGAEVFPMEDLPRLVSDIRSLTLGAHGRHLLLDMPLSTMPTGLETLVFQLQVQGVQVILAHPERSLPIQQHPQLLEPLIQRGVLTQINGSSLLGKNGPQAEAAARELLRHRWVHFLASDAHSPVHRRPGLLKAARELTAVVGAEMATTLLESNGQRVLSGEEIPSDPLPYTARKRGWFGKR